MMRSQLRKHSQPAAAGCAAPQKEPRQEDFRIGLEKPPVRSRPWTMAFAALCFVLSTGLICLLLPGEVRAAAGEVYPISRDSVNLVRVQGEAITNLVYDTEALEVQADKVRGVVYVRVKPAFLKLGKTETSAFFAAGTESYGITFRFEDIAAQTVQIRPSVRPGKETDTDGKAAEQEKKELGEILSAPMAPLAAGDFVSEIKTLVRSAATRRMPSAAADRLGSTFSGASGAALQLVDFAPRRGGWRGFSVTESSLLVSQKRLVDILEVRNLSARTQKLDWGALAGAVPDVLAVAMTEPVLEPGERSRVYVVRNREGISAPARALDFIARVSGKSVK